MTRLYQVTHSLMNLLKLPKNSQIDLYGDRSIKTNKLIKIREMEIDKCKVILNKLESQYNSLLNKNILDIDFNEVRL